MSYMKLAIVVVVVQGSKLKKMSGRKFATSLRKFGRNFENVSREIN